MPDGSFRRLARLAVCQLSEECPPMHARYLGALEGIGVSAGVGEETFGLQEGPVAVTAHLDPTTLLDLLDGRVSVLDAVLADRLLLVGRPDDLGRLGEALEAFLEGAARSPSFPALLAEVRAAAQSPSPRSAP